MYRLRNRIRTIHPSTLQDFTGDVALTDDEYGVNIYLGQTTE